MVQPIFVIDIPRGSLRDRGPEVIANLKKGNIVVVRAAPEIWALKDMLVKSMRIRGGDIQADEISNWCETGQPPSALTLAHFSNLLLEMKRAFIMPALLADFVGEIGFAEPLSVESGAPRFNVPKEVEEEFLGHDDIINPAVLGKAGDDPTFHHMWVGEYYPHRDIGRPHLGFQPNAWCALQDINEQSGMIFFPDAHRDPSCDRNYYKFNDDPDPANWGLGKPLKIPVNFGDIILFDSDHLHSSPITTGDFTRLSWEIRIHERCFDDVGWYKLGYLSHRNYRPIEDGDSYQTSIERAKSMWERFPERPSSPRQYFQDNKSTSTAIQFLNWVIMDQNMSQAFFEESLDVMMAFPFSEDRYLWPHFFAQKNYKSHEVDGRIQEHVIENSENYYWLLIYGGFALAAGRNQLADTAFNKAEILSSITKVDTLSNVVNYFEALKSGTSTLLPMLYQITPEDTKEIVRLYKQGLVIKGCDGETVKLVDGIPYPFGMFKPQYPFCEFYPPIEKAEKPSSQYLQTLLLKFRMMVRNRLISLSGVIPAPIYKFALDRIRQFPVREPRVGENWLPF